MFKDNQEIKILKGGEQIKMELIATDQILLWSAEAQENLRRELEYLFPVAFPKMPEKDWKDFVANYFRQPSGKSYRQAFLIKNGEDKLIAATIFDQGRIDYCGNVMKGIYLITCTILPKYQNIGLGKTVVSKILMELKPDIFFTTCYQSPALHWVDLPKKGLVTGFESYPRLERRNGEEVLITAPYKDFDFFINAFKENYLGVAKGDQGILDGVIGNLTVIMVRKNDHEEVYDFNPWERNGREDRLAKALRLTDKDGVLVIFRKT